jgi:hypothetical protein
MLVLCDVVVWLQCDGVGMLYVVMVWLHGDGIIAWWWYDALAL